MNIRIKYLVLTLLLLLATAQVYSNNRDSLIVGNEKSPTAYYKQHSAGFVNPIYRDFATSPLFYRGLGINLNSGWLKRSVKRERILSFDLEFGAFIPKIPKSQKRYIQPGGSSFMGQFSIYYHQLWKLESLRFNKYNIKIGGAIKLTQNIRYNAALENNALGLENVSNLMASAQFTREIRDFGFLNYKLKPAKREFRFLMNIGVLNFNYRPGYAYAFDSELNGTETSPVNWAFSNYKWSMNGWRLNTQLEFLKYLSNGNVRSWSYVWEAAHAKGRFESFQMASHRIIFTQLFQTKTN